MVTLWSACYRWNDRFRIYILLLTNATHFGISCFSPRYSSSDFTRELTKMPPTPSALDFDPNHSTILKDISTSLENQNQTATFALGGSIPNHPITIRFGNIPNQGSHITFPISHASHPSVLEDLISECQPASFGRGGEAVLDPTYRKAGALGTDLFATTFCPYRSGIVDVVQRMLLPMGNVRAELYKLNIYSAPSGKFKAHVDTPRDVSQFGSLVVGLPLLHEGA
jgi:hypothetical protein